MSGTIRHYLPSPTRRAALFGVLGAAVIAISPPLGFAALTALVALCLYDFVAARRRGAPEFTCEVPRRLAQGQQAEAVLRTEKSSENADLSLALSLAPELATDSALAITPLQLRAGQRSELNLPLEAHRRGRYRLEALDVFTTGALGLTRAEFRVPLDREILVLPGLLESARQSARAERTQRRVGLRRSRQRGGGGSFESMAEYVRGDDPRRVDWKASARHRRPMVRLYETERSQSLMLCLDTGRAMAERTLAANKNEPSGVEARNRLDHACEAASVLSRVARSFSDPTGLMAFSDTVHAERLPHASGWQKVPELLAELRARPVEPDYPTCLGRLDHLLARRSLVLVFSDLLDPIASEPIARALRPLAKRHLIVLVALRNPELESLASEPAETPGDALARASAAEMLGERERALASLRERGVTVLDVSPGRAVESAVARYLEIKASGAL